MECKYAVYLERVGAEVVECACVIGLPEVKVLLKPLQLKVSLSLTYWSPISSACLIISYF